MPTAPEQPSLEKIFRYVKYFYKKQTIYTPEAAALVINQSFSSYPILDESLKEFTILEDPNNWDKLAWKAREALQYNTYISKEQQKHLPLQTLLILGKAHASPVLAELA